MNVFKIIYKKIYHYFTARNTNGFGVHSPFMFQFIQNVLGEKHFFYVFSSIELMRKDVLKNNEKIYITDYGTGKNRQSTVKEIAKKSAKSPRFGQLLFRIVHYFKFKNVLELGTSLGISTAYLASSSSQIKCTTIEGCPQTASQARKVFKKLNLQNIELVEGNIDVVLNQVLDKYQTLDLIYIDANHKQEAVIRYFEKCLPKIHNESIIIFDDIHWSEDMEQAWNKILGYDEISSSIDLFEMGIVFFNKDLSKKRYKVFYK